MFDLDLAKPNTINLLQMISLKLRYYLTGIILFFFISTFAQEGKIDSSKIVTLRLDPQSARGATVSQLFDEVKFVPLETTKESLFGNISQFKTIDNLYLIFDYDTKAILIFNLEGKYITKIDATKLESNKDNNEKMQFYGFTTIKDNNQQLIAIYTPKNAQLYDLKGKFVKKIPNEKFNFNNDTEFEDGKTKVTQGLFIKNGKDSTYFQLGLKHQNPSDSIGYFKDDIKKYAKDEWFGYSGISKYAPNEAFFISHYNYNIYRVTPNNVALAYKIIFPVQNSLPDDFLTNPIYVKKRLTYFQDNKKVIYGLGMPYLFGNNLFLKTHSFYWDKDRKSNLIYNLKTTELTSFQDIEPDSLSHFLPITDSGFTYDFENRGFLAFENDRFYTSYSSLAMRTFKERSAGKTTKYPALLENYFKVSDRKSNPVLVILKPKKN